MLITGRKTANKLVLLFLLFTVRLVCTAQTVVYDWSGNSKTPEPYPTIRTTQLVTFKIKKVNDILFSYRLEVTQTPIPGNDFEVLRGLLGFAARSTALDGHKSTCKEADIAQEKLDAALKKINGDPNLPVGYGALPKHEHVSLDQTVNAWKLTGSAREEVDKSIAVAQSTCGDLGGLQVAYDEYSKA